MINFNKIVKYTKNLNLLYVEDNEDNRISTILLLEDLFDNIIVAEDGKEGLKKFQENKIDIVITDIDMPIMDGLEMSKHIKTIDKTTPILIFSAYSEEKTFIKAIHIDVDGYLLKPIQMDQFLKSLSKSLEGLTHRNENIKYKYSLEQMVAEKLEELREKDRLLFQQAKMASMGEMIDAIAHQWKQPLNTISMQKELVKMDIDSGVLDMTSVKEAIDVTSFQIEHLVNTMNEFRRFFRPNKSIEKLNIKNLLDSIMILLKDELLKYTTELNIVCDSNISIYANDNDIKHLFINLINNAKDAMIKNNIKNIDRKIIIECLEDENSIEISIKDNGLGIPQDIINKIFQANFTTKEDNGGTGIGLYMCKQIVDKYAGKINVSNGASGAIFKIVLNKSTP